MSWLHVFSSITPSLQKDVSSHQKLCFMKYSIYIIIYFIILVNAVIILILSAITVSLIVPSFSHTAIKYIQMSECKSFESTFSFLLLLLLKVVNCVSSISRGSGLNECKVENTKCNLIIIKSTAGARDMFFFYVRQHFLVCREIYTIRVVRHDERLWKWNSH